jgi:localization factor PodJL
VTITTRGRTSPRASCTTAIRGRTSPRASCATTTIAASPTAPAQPAAPPVAAADLVTAQRSLNQLGYYQGPTDGVASPALHLAIASYQRDHGLAVTGSPDPTTVGKLSVYTQ